MNPLAVELVGDEVDGDCNGVEECYVDADGDGYRTTEVVQSIDSDCADDGEATVDEPLVDCDDSLANVNPGAEEIPGDGLDQTATAWTRAAMTWPRTTRPNRRATTMKTPATMPATTRTSRSR